MITPGLKASCALTVLLLLAGVASCDKVPLTAPTGSSVTLTANTEFLPVNGVAELTATVIESAGTFVQNGTLVSFSTTLGTLEPAEARTQGGKATVRLHAGTRSGTATIRAVSGSAAGSGGDDGGTSNQVTIAIGSAGAGRVALSANPSSVPSTGGTSVVTAVVFDTSGNRLAGVPVSFTTTAGSLSAGVVTSDANGEARSSLTTTRNATVTASVGGGESAQSATVEIAALAIPVVTVSASPAAPFAGQAVTLTISATATEGAIRTVTIDYGDARIDTLGPVTSVQHVYSSPGTYTVRVTAEDSNGSRGTGSTTIVVAETPPPLINLTASASPITLGTSVTFTVAITPQGGYSPIVQSVTWDFGDGNVEQNNGLTRPHVYGSTGNFRVVATVRFTDGTSGRGETAVQVR